MNATNPDRASPSFEEEAGDVVEVPLLMSIRQIEALEKAAHRRGLTAAEMVRRLLTQFIAEAAPPSICRA